MQMWRGVSPGSLQMWRGVGPVSLQGSQMSNLADTFAIAMGTVFLFSQATRARYAFLKRHYQYP